jgi:hypothetical protein
MLLSTNSKSKKLILNYELRYRRAFSCLRTLTREASYAFSVCLRHPVGERRERHYVSVAVASLRSLLASRRERHYKLRIIKIPPMVLVC